MSEIKRQPVFHLFYQIYKFVFYIPFLVVATVIFSILVILLSVLLTRNIAYLAARIWAMLLTLATPMKVDVRGGQNIVPDQSYVVVSNHQSHFDITALVGFLPMTLIWVGKHELRKVPIFGYAAEKIGVIFIDRSNRETAIASMDRAKSRVKDGDGVIFMAEGTRSVTGELLPFKKGAFRFALDLGLPILPITVNGTKNVLPKNTLDLYPGKSSITIHPPIDISQYREVDLEQLIHRTRETVQSALV